MAGKWHALTSGEDEPPSSRNVRNVDQLGRVIIPAELREQAGLHAGAAIAFRFADGHIVLTKVRPQCVLCGSRRYLSLFRGAHICVECVRGIRDAPELGGLHPL